MSGRRALRRAASLAAGAEQTRGERDEATRMAPAGEAGARMEPLSWRASVRLAPKRITLNPLV